MENINQISNIPEDKIVSLKAVFNLADMIDFSTLEEQHPTITLGELEKYNVTD